MESSDDDDDVHQCVKCKAVFLNLEEYIAHKKRKSCKKFRAADCYPTGPITIDITQLSCGIDAPSGDTHQSSGDAHQSSGDAHQSLGDAHQSPGDARQSSGDTHQSSCDVCQSSSGASQSLDDGLQSLGHTEQSTPDARQSPCHAIKSSDNARKDISSKDSLQSCNIERDTIENIIDAPKVCCGKRGKQRAVRVAKKKKVSPLSEKSEGTNNCINASSAKLREKEHTRIKRPIRSCASKDQKQKTLTGNANEVVDTDDDDDWRETGMRKTRKMTKYRSKNRDDDIPPFSCSFCHQLFSEKSEFDRHLRRKHSVSKYWCKKCQASFADQYKLKRHQTSGACCQNGTTPAAASQTNGEYIPVSSRMQRKKNAQNLKEIVENARGDTSVVTREELFGQVSGFRCHACGVEYERFGDLHEHLKTHHSEISPAVCCFCGQWFSTQYHIQRHINSSVHDDVADNVMNAFKEFLKDQKSFNWKPEKSTESSVIKCNICGESCRSQLALKKHNRKFHFTSTDKTYSCSNCNASFPVRSKLRDHVRRECPMKPRTQCDVCERNFKHSSHMLRHMTALHTPIPQAPSDGFTNQAAVGETTCTEASSFSCFVCTKTFFDSSSFNSHLHDHRVWTANQDGGPCPIDLFDSFPQPPPFVDKTEKSKLWYTQHEEISLDQTESELPQDEQELTDDGQKTSDHDLLQNLLLEINQVAQNAEEIPSPKEVSETVLEMNSKEDCLSTMEKPDADKENNAKKKCPYCLKQYSDLSGLYNHKVNYHKLVLVFRCCLSSCKEVFPTVEEYTQHQHIHRQAAFICSICNEHLGSMGELITHKQVQHRSLYTTNAAENACGICNRSFSSKAELEAHLQNDRAHHPCSTCGKVFRKPAELKYHEASHTGIKPFLCDLCGCTFANKTYLQRHRQTHSSTRDIKCEHCGSCFLKREHLRRHILTIHSDEKPFACTYPGCNKAFKRKDRLQEHFKCHSMEKRFTCGVCGRKYRNKEGLQYHEKAHQRATGYKCPICEVLIPSMGQLRQHLVEVHQLSIKKSHIYRCVSCGASFSRPERVKRHMEKEHGLKAEWASMCPICGEGFAGSKSLSKHFEKCHNDSGTNRKTRRNRRIKTLTNNSGPVESLTQGSRIESETSVVLTGNAQTVESLTATDLEQQNLMEETITQYVQVKCDSQEITTIPAIIKSSNADEHLIQPVIQPDEGMAFQNLSGFQDEVSKSMSGFIPHQSVLHAGESKKTLAVSSLKQHRFNYMDIPETSGEAREDTINLSMECADNSKPQTYTEDNGSLLAGPQAGHVTAVPTEEPSIQHETSNRSSDHDTSSQFHQNGASLSLVSDQTRAQTLAPPHLPSIGEVSVHPLYLQETPQLARQPTQNLMSDKFILVPHMDRSMDLQPQEHHLGGTSILTTDTHLIQGSAPIQLMPPVHEQSTRDPVLASVAHSGVVLGDMGGSSGTELQQYIIPIGSSGTITLPQTNPQLPSLASIQSIGTFMNYLP